MTVWLKWQCEKGNRWLTPAGNLHYDEVDGGDCTRCCARCSYDHKISFMGETSDRSEAPEWLFDVSKKRR